MKFYDVHFFDTHNGYSLLVKSNVGEDELISLMVSQGIIDRDEAQYNDYIEETDENHFKEFDGIICVS